ncbi:hypothetical protein FRACYDRAFT_240377 [Fragilariopsis cylindrus CCMP1102]|uniref:Uncharacterized protein n=1 Tax=Fragilariopsis cylindrus CCMP1102 TaxID=635003 RepID=A0A1E7FC21_9STRA|nr:hypothetical protein FRACYDRAFT_240377 [Fragilariopsis cylindrus CCMP1102]|eukprot:OEU15684.1 hypothetical protein FRACYDRAFT_240377 [Fragilariopsis cylindrus CCMP1102]
MVKNGQIKSLSSLEGGERILDYCCIVDTFYVNAITKKITKLNLDGLHLPTLGQIMLPSMDDAIPNHIARLNMLEDFECECYLMDPIQFKTSMDNVFQIKNLKRLTIRISGSFDRVIGLPRILKNRLQKATDDVTDEYYCAFKNKLELLDMTGSGLNQEFLSTLLVDVTLNFPELKSLSVSDHSINIEENRKNPPKQKRKLK